MDPLLHTFYTLGSTRDKSHNFLTLASGILLLLFAMQNHHILLIVSCALKPNNLSWGGGHFKGDILGLFHSFECTSFELWDIYEYQIIQDNLLLKYHQTEYSSHVLSVS